MKIKFLIFALLAAAFLNIESVAFACVPSPYVNDVEIIDSGVKITNRARDEKSTESKVERFYPNSSPVIGLIKASVTFAYISVGVEIERGSNPSVGPSNQRIRARKYSETRAYIIENLNQLKRAMGSSDDTYFKRGLSDLNELLPLLVAAPTAEQFRAIELKMGSLFENISGTDVNLTVTETPPPPQVRNGPKTVQLRELRDRIPSSNLFPILSRATSGCGPGLGVTRGGPFAAATGTATPPPRFSTK